MKPSLKTMAAWLAVVALVAVAASGCGKKTESLFRPAPLRPVVYLTSAPAVRDSINPVRYDVRLTWVGYDADGRVDHYLYTIDPHLLPVGADTAWTRTSRNEQTVFFHAGIPDSVNRTPTTSSEPHVFMIKAVGDDGLFSELVFRAFFATTVAPTVDILNPRPSHLLDAYVTPSVQINWTGEDPDGQFTQKPVKYKYLLLNDPPLVQAVSREPDYLRRISAPGFAAWDSVGAETTSVQYTDLVPNSLYLFALIGIDEAGAYSPVFSLDHNLLRFTVGFAGIMGPIITMYNEFFNYTYGSGGYSTDPSREVRLEVPADKRITFNWFATPPSGARIAYYRWVLDIADLGDNTPRTNENTDWYHWSAKDPQNFACTIGPFDTGEHFFYVEAGDNNGMISLGIIHFTVIRPTFDRPLLLVNDTRYFPESVARPPGGPITVTPTGTWPNIAELDTFLFARGNVPWQGYWVSPGVPRTSPPGIFNGYDFDTVGTRIGKRDLTVPLSTLGKYRHVVWFVDGNKGALNLMDGTDPLFPRSALRYMNGPGKANTLATYVGQGGLLWLLGGGSGFVTEDAWPGQRPPGNVFTFRDNELIPGRFMYDLTHWRSVFTQVKAPARIVKSERAVGGWAGAPDYSLLPARMEAKTAATDPLSQWPGRTTTQFFATQFEVEYLGNPSLGAPNEIIEDYDPDPINEDLRSTLDTLYEVGGAVFPLPDVNNPYPTAIMTFYHGLDNTPLIFSGFNIWNFRRAQCIELADWVLQRVWHLDRDPAAPREPSFVGPAAARTAGRSAVVRPTRQPGRNPAGLPRE
jgi:hypothetical protein